MSFCDGFWVLTFLEPNYLRLLLVLRPRRILLFSKDFLVMSTARGVEHVVMMLPVTGQVALYLVG